MNSTPSVADFIAAIFPDPGDDERVLLTRNDDGFFSNYGWTPRTARIVRDAPWYFCVSTVRPAERELKRDRESLHTAYCVVLDDVGTKATAPEVGPSWVLESSPGNQQWGYLIEPLALDPKGMALYEGCVRGLAQAGHTDGGAGGAYRVMRVPGSVHKTGFVSRVLSWEPGRFWGLEVLMGEMGVEPVERAVFDVQRRAVPSNLAMDDPVLRWLDEQGLVLGANEKFVEVVCPWHAEHTDGGLSAGYSPVGYYDQFRSFSCFHEHCEGRKIAQFQRWVEEQGGPSGRFRFADTRGLFK